MSRPAVSARFHHAPGLWQSLADAMTGTARLFASDARRPSGLELVERETDQVRLDSRLWLL